MPVRPPGSDDRRADARAGLDGAVALGLILIAVGVVLTLDNLGLVSAPDLLAGFWPVAGAVVGVWLVVGGNAVVGLFVVAVSGVLQLSVLDLVPASIGQLVLPSILLVLAGAFLQAGRQVRAARVTWAAALEQAAQAGRPGAPILAPTATAVLADAVLVVDDVVPEGGRVVVSATSVLGDVRIEVPSGWRVEDHLTRVLGDVDLPQPRGAASEDAPVVLLHGLTLLGDIEVVESTRTAGSGGATDPTSLRAARRGEPNDPAPGPEPSAPAPDPSPPGPEPSAPGADPSPPGPDAVPPGPDPRGPSGAVAAAQRPLASGLTTVGVLLLLAGVSRLLVDLGVLPTSAADALRTWWPAVLVGAGGWLVLAGRRALGAVALILGVLLLAPRVMPAAFIVPALLIVIGLVLLLGAGRGRRWLVGRPGVVALFDDQRDRDDGRPAAHAFVAVFGDADGRLDPDTAAEGPIECLAVFGTVTVVVPPQVQVTVAGTAILGDVRTPVPPTAPIRTVVPVRATAILGDVRLERG
ncbi:MAG: LiaF transmembrane domain-containing protein [Nitriliruptoraceae bacterium]